MSNTAKVVRFLKDHKEQSFTIKQIARALGFHYVTVWRELIKLEQEKLIIEEQPGLRLRVFQWKE